MGLVVPAMCKEQERNPEGQDGRAAAGLAGFLIIVSGPQVGSSIQQTFF